MSTPPPAPPRMRTPWWSWAVPVAAAAALVLGLLVGAGGWMTLLCLPALIGAVLVSVHHAELIAHRLGEPLGTLVLAIAITVIEVALIVSAMVGGDPEKASLPRDTIFATIMIICNGVMGLCLLVGSLAHREQTFRVDGIHAAFAALITLTTLSLVLPSFTTSSHGATFTPAQLGFSAIASLSLWAVFIFGQTIRHREYFLPPTAPLGDVESDTAIGTSALGTATATDAHDGAPHPTAGQAWASLGLLLLSLIAVVGLAKQLSPAIESGLHALHAPKGVLGIAIALLVLLPETVAAIRAARANRLQTSFNLALGSALASIGLTIPAVVLASVLFDLPLVLGLDGKSVVMLAVTFLVGTVTLASGRTNVIQAGVHLVLFAAFLFLSIVP